MTDSDLILSFIGDDRPGLVGELARVVAEHQGNWLESSMAHLAGKFAGVVRVAVPAASAAGLQDALRALGGLRVSCEAGTGGAAVPGRRLTLSLVGQDRPGIVREVTQVLARHAINVEQFETRTESAAMSAEMLFHAEAELTAGAGVDLAELAAELERISNDLMVDMVLGEE